MKTNYRLIILEQGNIIVSDEDLRKLDWKHCSKTNYVTQFVPEAKDSLADKCEYCKKLIASNNPKHNHLPNIDYNGLEEKFGIVDLEKLAKETTKKYINEREKQTVYLEFIEGFKKAQSLNDKKFSLEDIEKSIEMTIELMRNKYTEFRTHKNTILQSLQQPKIFDIEVEMEYFYMSSKEFYGKNADWVKCDKSQYDSIKSEISTCPIKIEPKITNNSIKITKVVDFM